MQSIQAVLGHPQNTWKTVIAGGESPGIVGLLPRCFGDYGFLYKWDSEEGRRPNSVGGGAEPPVKLKSSDSHRVCLVISGSPRIAWWDRITTKPQPVEPACLAQRRGPWRCLSEPEQQPMPIDLTVSLNYYHTNRCGEVFFWMQPSARFLNADPTTHPTPFLPPHGMG
jgi:hypothetical protein